MPKIPPLSESDLRFVVETIATKRHDHERVLDIIRGKDDLIEPMLDDPKLLERIQNPRAGFEHLSPNLFFATLLRQLRSDLQTQNYLFEVEPDGKRLPVFEGAEAAGMLSDSAMMGYLVQMLCSFVRANTGVVYWKERGTWHRRKFSDIDLDDMITLAQMVDPELKPRYLQRAADLALFSSGIYPDQALSLAARGRRRRPLRRTIADYDRDGPRFYAAAANRPVLAEFEPVLRTLSEKFALARRVLNTLHERYLQYTRAELFEGR